MRLAGVMRHVYVYEGLVFDPKGFDVRKRKLCTGKPLSADEHNNDPIELVSLVDFEDTVFCGSIKRREIVLHCESITLRTFDDTDLCPVCALRLDVLVMNKINPLNGTATVTEIERVLLEATR